MFERTIEKNFNECCLNCQRLINELNYDHKLCNSKMCCHNTPNQNGGKGGHWHSIIDACPCGNKFKKVTSRENIEDLNEYVFQLLTKISQLENDLELTKSKKGKNKLNDIFQIRDLISFEEDLILTSKKCK